MTAPAKAKEARPLLSPQQAAQCASNYLNALIPLNPAIPPTVEEVELSNDEKYWRITLGFTPAQQSSVGFFLAGGREYKIFEVNVFNGDVKSMKIRKL